MNGRTPFLLVPWQQDFLRALARRAALDTGGDISRASFIFPHARPLRYLALQLKRDTRLKKPLLMPRMFTVSGLFKDLAGRLDNGPRQEAGLLDRVGLLLACARREMDLEARDFFPWGLRLAALFEECAAHCLKPANFLHAEGAVSPYAAMLLARLGNLYEGYSAALAERGWTTPGRDAALAVRALQADPRLATALFPGNAEDRPLYIAGFHLLTGAEQALFHSLWQDRGARVLIHADPALAGKNGERPHWSCLAFADWAKDWGARIVPLDEAASAAPGADAATGAAQNNPGAIVRASAATETHGEARPEPRLRYVAAYDLHSQLAVLRQELAARPGPCEGAANAPEQSPDAPQPPATPATPATLAGDSGQQPLAGDVVGQQSLAPEPFAEAPDRQADTAVILPSGSLLLPVLHHLPGTDINISMGYPLARSPLFRLLDTLARLQERRKDRGYYWRDMVDLIRHPYIKMLRPEASAPDNGQTEAASLRPLLHRLEQSLRQRGQAFVDPPELLKSCLAALEPVAGAAQATLLERVLTTCLEGFSGLADTASLAAALEKVCILLVGHGQSLWQRFPIDAECLYRLRQSVIPELGRSALAAEAFPADSLFAMLRGLLEAERVPFEAEPLVGLQVMGMLESRLLSFKRVIVVDATEEHLPGSPAGDPLLPDALRPELGLPPRHGREQASAYTFFRLLRSADQALLLWREGGGAAGIQEQKSGKSRFVEELLWQEEKKRGSLLAPQARDNAAEESALSNIACDHRGKSFPPAGSAAESQNNTDNVPDTPYTIVSARVTPVAYQRPAVAISPEIKALINDLVQKPLSASLLDGYLRCPVQFYHERLLRIAPAQEVSEGDDPLAVGDLVHRVLHDAYKPHLGKNLPGGEELAALLGKDVLEAFFASPGYAALARSLPADSLAMLSEAASLRLGNYLAAQPPTTPLALETSFNALLRTDHGEFRLTGTADRLDKRLMPDGREALVVLDYKTGRLPFVGAGIWEDDALWRAMAAWRPDAEADPLPDLARRMQSVQLPLYMLLISLATAQATLPPALQEHARLPAANAYWLELGGEGRESALFSSRAAPDLPEFCLQNRFPALMDFLIRHLTHSSAFVPRPGLHCDWCFCEKLCIRAAGPQ